MSAPAESLWTVADVAQFLSMSRQWVYKHAELGSLPCVRFGASLRFQASEIRRYVEQRAQRQPARLLPLHRTE
ncbi:MAG: helix-turn-helix domain-containing protein [Archangium sp.]|nr:helix-turn-helix domain-containing protein [Archangium sp.]